MRNLAEQIAYVHDQYGNPRAALAAVAEDLRGRWPTLGLKRIARVLRAVTHPERPENGRALRLAIAADPAPEAASPQEYGDALAMARAMALLDNPAPSPTDMATALKVGAYPDLSAQQLGDILSDDQVYPGLNMVELGQALAAQHFAVAEITPVLRSVFEATFNGDELTEALAVAETMATFEDPEVSLTDMAGALVEEGAFPDLSAAQVVGILLDPTVEPDAGADDMADALQAADYAFDDIAGGLKAGYHNGASTSDQAAAQAVADNLHQLDAPAPNDTQLAMAIKSEDAFPDLSSTAMAEIIHSPGIDPSISETDMSQLLQNVGYDFTDIATALKAVYGHPTPPPPPPPPAVEPVKKGPVGSVKATGFSDWPAVKNNGAVTSMTVHHGNILDGIQLHYANGQSGDFHGGRRGAATAVPVSAKDPIVSVAGFWGSWFGRNYILQVTFTTKKGRTLGPYGNMGFAKTKKPFHLEADGRSLIGLCGSYIGGREADGSSTLFVTQVGALFA